MSNDNDELQRLIDAVLRALSESKYNAATIALADFCVANRERLALTPAAPTVDPLFAVRTLAEVARWYSGMGRERSMRAAVEHGWAHEWGTDNDTYWTISVAGREALTPAAPVTDAGEMAKLTDDVRDYACSCGYLASNCKMGTYLCKRDNGTDETHKAAQ